MTNAMMQTSFQKLCIRPDVGFAYDKNSMVDIADGGLFTELLCKVTSKADTSLLLLTSHKGKIQDFTIKLIGLQSPKTPSSVTSAVLSGFKKGLSYLDGSGSYTASEQPDRSDAEQVAQAWEECEANGYHGMQVVSLIDKEMMPDNDCRKLYNLHQFMTLSLQSIYAYYMFQKPDVAFVYDADFSCDVLTETYPDADTFAVAIMWRFADNPKSITGRIRPTPIISRTNALTDTSAASPRASRKSLLESSIFRTPSVTSAKKKVYGTTNWAPVQNRQLSLSTSKRQPLEESAEEESDYEDVEDTEEEVSNVSLVSSRRNVEGTAPIRRVKRQLPSTPPTVSSPVQDVSAKIPSPFATTAPAPVPSARAATHTLLPVRVSKPLTPAKAAVATPQPVRVSNTPQKRRAVAAPATPVHELDLLSVRRVCGTPKRQSATPSGRSKRKIPEDEPQQPEIDEEEEDMEEEEDIEVSFKPPVKLNNTTVVESMETGYAADTTIDPSSIVFSFDDTPAAAVGGGARGGRKSMAARKSLAAVDWPSEHHHNILHFYDNINPSNSETSRVALTCKYALLQYDRDLPSKQLYTWIQRKGRPSLREHTSYALQESERKSTALLLYTSLSGAVQSEATRMSFTLKFLQAQYGIACTSKQLFIWLKEKPKKAKK